MFAGQALTGLAMDSFAGGKLALAKLLGTILVLAGLGLGALLDRHDLEGRKRGESRG